LLAAIDGAAAWVTNDSGPMHIAVALGRPVTAIIGPTNPHRTGPWRQLSSVVQAAMDCAACNKRRCPKADAQGEPLCMASISVASVFENLQQHVTRA
jgi:ADP-heptose:LPS heptosyltransferase